MQERDSIMCSLANWQRQHEELLRQKGGHPEIAATGEASLVPSTSSEGLWAS